MTDIAQIRARLNTSYKLGSIDSRDEDIKTLLREVERLAKDVDSLNSVLRNAGWGQGEIDNAASVCERLEADARRWRWMRANGPECLSETILGFPVYVNGHKAYCLNEAADTLVDNAIAASQGREVSGGNKP